MSGALEERAPNDLQAIKLQDEWNKCNHLSHFFFFCGMRHTMVKNFP